MKELAGRVLEAALHRWLGTARTGPLDHIQRSRGHAVEALQRVEDLRRVARTAAQATVWLELADAALAVDDFDTARMAYEQVLKASPRHAPALNGLAHVLGVCGEVDAAIGVYRQAAEGPAPSLEAFQSMLFLMLCSGRTTDEEILAWHRRFARTWEAPLRKAWEDAGAAAVRRKRLRIALISKDLRDHVTGRFVEPLIAHLDRKAFEVHCYFEGPLADDFTQKLRTRGGHWHDMARLDDRALAAHIRSQRIDVLIDLSGHTPGNRVGALMRRPAPVQVSYLDYSATLGLDSVGYRLTTEDLDPQGRAEPFYNERLVRLESAYWVYNPVQAVQETSTPKGWLLFSCLNSFYRVTDLALETWAKVLRRVPQSRLALVGVPEGRARERVVRTMGKWGIARGRLEFFGFLNYGHYTQLVRATDVALGPFPYNGATTLLDCLWQGTPVISLKGGPTFRSSMGNAVHRLVGLESLLAADLDAYVEVAVALAQDDARRADLRDSLRQQVEASPLRDGRRLAAAVGRALQDIWREHCTQRSTHSD